MEVTCEPNWIQKILGEVGQVSADQARLAEPTEEVGVGEKVVGIADLGVQRLFALMCSYAQRADAACEAIKSAKPEELGDREHVAESLLLQHSSVHDAFWASVRDAHGLWTAEHIAIRKGWQVVVVPSEPKRQPVLGGLMILEVGGKVGLFGGH